MTSFKLVAQIPDRATAMRVAGVLQDLMDPPPDALTVFEAKGADGEVIAWTIETYFTEARSGDALSAEVEALLGEPAPRFVPDEVPDLNWVALSQAALPPVKAHRFTVHGTHDIPRVPQGPNAILIDAGEAFGTAHHATTYGCLIAIDRLAQRRRFRRILDLGCGSGILAIAAARAWPKASIDGVDIDAQSVIVAKENAKANGAAKTLRFICGAGVDDPTIRRRAPFDLIIANILAAPLIMLSPDLRRISRPGSMVVLSGILTREAATVIAAYRAQGFILHSHRRYDGWSALTLEKYGAA